MRLKIHHNIGKKVYIELKDLDCKISKTLFLFGNVFPDLIYSYIWRRHEFKHSRKIIEKKIITLKKRTRFYSFHMGILTHYICDYFCFPHSTIYNKGLIKHIIYEMQQKVPDKIYKTKLNIKAFTIEELEKLVRCYEKLVFTVNSSHMIDFHLASIVTSNFLQAAY